MTLSSNCAQTTPILPALLPAGCTVFKNGLTLQPGLPYNEWLSVGKRLSEVAGAAMWMLGDWLAYGEHHYRKSKWNDRVANGLYAQLAEDTGYAEQTLRNAKYVCAALPLSARTNKLTFTHALQIVAYAPEEQREFWIGRTVNEGLSVKKLREQIRKAKAIYQEEPNDKGAKSVLEEARQYARDLNAAKVSPIQATEILRILAAPLRRIVDLSKAA